MFDPKAAVAIVAVLSGTAITCTALFVWSRWLNRTRTTEPTLESEVRIRRLEQVIESMANELERIGEHQQFTTRLLTERPAADQAMIDRTAREHAPLIIPPTAYRPQTTPH